MANFTLSKICNPAKLFLVISVVLLAGAIFKRINSLTILIKGVFILLWTFILNWLCSKGFETLAWVIVLLPFIFLFFTVFTVMDFIGYKEGFQLSWVKIGSPCPSGTTIVDGSQNSAGQEGNVMCMGSDFPSGE